MKLSWLCALPHAVHRTLHITGGLLIAAALVSCGGGGTLPKPLAETDRRPLPTEFTSRAAASYSPFRTATSPDQLGSEVITPTQVEQDLRLVRSAGIGVIRLFSSRGFAETVLGVIRDQGLGLKVMLGAYVNPLPDASSGSDTSALQKAEDDNQAELDRCIELANRYSDVVSAVSVGNETMVSWSAHALTPATMAGYLRKVRAAILQPVTTDDNWAFWASAPKVITDVVDFASVHTYPVLDTYYDPSLWDWRQKAAAPDKRADAMMDAAIAEASRQFNQARSFLDRIGLESMPMVIGETGWTAVDVGGGPALAYRAHPVNQKMYYDRLQAWVSEGRTGRGPQAIFYFEAFDEAWKGSDDGWGLFNRNREARYVVQGFGTCGVTWACEAGTYTAADAVHWTAPTVNAAVTGPRYTLFSEVLTAGETRPTGLRWDPFANTGYGLSANAAPGDGSAGFEINPAPLDYGWGLFNYSASGVTENLSAFANGSLNFWIRTDGYPGRLEIGISTDTDDRDVQEAYVQLAPGQMGYCNDNRWCQVSIPVQSFVSANPKIDLRLVSFRFIIADRYAFTGNAPGTKPKITLDGIYWAP